jgi:hypothetical protein
MNPVVVTATTAEMCSWAADMIELLGSYLSDPQLPLSTIKDYRVREIVEQIEDMRSE